MIMGNRMGNERGGGRMEGMSSGRKIIGVMGGCKKLVLRVVSVK